MSSVGAVVTGTFFSAENQDTYQIKNVMPLMCGSGLEIHTEADFGEF